VTTVPGPPEPPLATSLGLLTWRPRTDEDQGLLRALFASSRRAELDLMGADPDQERAFVDLQLRARDGHRDATRPDAALFVVTLDGLAVGQLDLDRTPTTVEVLEIALVPGLRGHGLGTTVLARVLDDADAAGLAVRLHVEPANPARRLYERLGFVATGAEGIHLAMERPAAGATDPDPATAPPAPPTVAGPPGTAPPPTPPPDGPPDLPPMPTYDDLAPHVGTTIARLPDGPDLELVEIVARPLAGRPGPVPFSALFAGPLDRPLGQGIHRLDLPGTGPIELFIVPLTPADGRALYELIVN
jgi:ribosomal protein S18 acetylase RimI-like enzyme